MTRGVARICLLGLAALSAGRANAAELDFAIDSPFALNHFYRDGDVAAHINARSGTRPRVLVAFPAGNSGAGIWFTEGETPVKWSITKPATARHKQTPAGVRRGISFEIECACAALDVRDAMVGNVRSLREFERTGSMPEILRTRLSVHGNTLGWQRPRLDGAAGYALSLTVRDGRVVSENGHVRLRAADGQQLKMSVEALTGDVPLKPLPAASLLNANAAGDEQLRDVLTFLSYEDKFLAGSWRFNTYFGRDTLMSLMLLYPALRPDAVETGIRSVLERLNESGEVAHEEDIGEFAILDHLAKGEPANAAPVFDYKMVDDDFMLLPLVARYVDDSAVGEARARAFLDTRMADGSTVRDHLRRNVDFVVSRAAVFASEPQFRNLVALKPGQHAGDWRDSDDGLGGGRYSYSVNCALVPAALDAAAALAASGLLGDLPDRDKIAAMAGAWRRHAPPLFEVRLDGETATRRAAEYAGRLGIAASPAAAGPVRFWALSLDAEGRPVPVVHSDIGFELLFMDPPAERLRDLLALTLQPFPAGLASPEGLIVANPAYAPEELQPRFDRTRYHGTVIWSWQQALLKAGLQRQLRRSDLSAELRTVVANALHKVDEMIAGTHTDRAAELWTWDVNGGHIVAAPFGANAADEDETNAAQLWSTVFIGVNAQQ